MDETRYLMKTWVLGGFVCVLLCLPHSDGDFILAPSCQRNAADAIEVEELRFKGSDAWIATAADAPLVIQDVTSNCTLQPDTLTKVSKIKDGVTMSTEDESIVHVCTLTGGAVKAPGAAIPISCKNNKKRAMKELKELSEMITTLLPLSPFLFEMASTTSSGLSSGPVMTNSSVLDTQPDNEPFSGSATPPDAATTVSSPLGTQSSDIGPSLEHLVNPPTPKFITTTQTPQSGPRPRMGQSSSHTVGKSPDPTAQTGQSSDPTGKSLAPTAKTGQSLAPTAQTGQSLSPMAETGQFPDPTAQTEQSLDPTSQTEQSLVPTTEESFISTRESLAPTTRESLAPITGEFVTPSAVVDAAEKTTQPVESDQGKTENSYEDTEDSEDIDTAVTPFVKDGHTSDSSIDDSNSISIEPKTTTHTFGTMAPNLTDPNAVTFATGGLETIKESFSDSRNASATQDNNLPYIAGGTAGALILIIALVIIAKVIKAKKEKKEQERRKNQDLFITSSRYSTFQDEIQLFEDSNDVAIAGNNVRKTSLLVKGERRASLVGDMYSVEDSEVAPIVPELAFISDSKVSTEPSTPKCLRP